MGGDVSYEDLSISALLATALLGVEDWRTKRELRDGHLEGLLSHLWEWPTVGPDTFNEWEQWTSPALEFGLGAGTFPSEMKTSWADAGLTEGDARTLLRSLVEIVYGHLFAAIERGRVLSDFHIVRQFLECDGIPLRPPAAFSDSPVADMHGWGFRLDPQRRDEWRQR
jgi:hypothetical protein